MEKVSVMPVNKFYQFYQLVEFTSKKNNLMNAM